MRLTSSFAVFRYQPGEEGLAKARWYSREGQAAEAEQAYRAAIAAQPDLRSGWRRDGRHQEALQLAGRAEAHFGPDTAMPLAIKGAALAELGRTRDAVAALEGAIERDGNLALAWHELAYAAFRAGEYARALLVLDRAFALEPHTDTLMLRGRILRAAGQYDAAEVAFEAAQQSAEHDVPQREAEREIAATRRSASFGGKKPRQFTARERAFADLGAVLLDRRADEAAPLAAADAPAVFAACLPSLAGLVDAMAWRPVVCSGIAPEDEALAGAVARAIGAQALPISSLDPADRPLVVAMWNGGGKEWTHHLARLDRWRSGYAFALAQAPGVAESADVIGTLRWPGDLAALQPVVVRTLAAPATAAAVEPDLLALARSPLARWRARLAAPAHQA